MKWVGMILGAIILSSGYPRLYAIGTLNTCRTNLEALLLPPPKKKSPKTRRGSKLVQTEGIDWTKLLEHYGLESSGFQSGLRVLDNNPTDGENPFRGHASIIVEKVNRRGDPEGSLKLVAIRSKTHQGIFFAVMEKETGRCMDVALVPGYEETTEGLITYAKSLVGESIPENKNEEIEIVKFDP